MKYLKKFEGIDFGNENYRPNHPNPVYHPLPLDIQETLTELFYTITDCDIDIEVSKGTVGGYESNIGINIGCKSLDGAIKFNFDETHIITILEVIDYLESKGRKLDYFWYRSELKGMATTIYPKDIEKELRSLPNELYFIVLQFVKN